MVSRAKRKKKRNDYCAQIEAHSVIHSIEREAELHGDMIRYDIEHKDYVYVRTHGAAFEVGEYRGSMLKYVSWMIETDNEKISEGMKGYYYEYAKQTLYGKRQSLFAIIMNALVDNYDLLERNVREKPMNVVRHVRRPGSKLKV